MSILKNFGKKTQNLSQSQEKTKYGLSNFLKIANGFVNADTTTLEGIEKKLMDWFATKYNTTLNDDRLLDMTLEELLVEFHRDKIHTNPEVLAKVGAKTSEEEDYEEWLKKEMGEEYLSEEQMVEMMAQEEKEYQEKIKKKFPDKITTDFSQFDKE